MRHREPEASDAWIRWADADALVVACAGDEALAREIFDALGSAALEWMDEAVPALDHRRPRALARTRPGRHEIRSMLVRLP
jgi:uncharacterized protein (DUF2384 family)